MDSYLSILLKRVGSFRSWFAWLISFTLSYGVVYFLTQFYPTQLNTKTHVIGFPIHGNFNINRLFFIYYAYLLIMPMLALAILECLRRLNPISLIRSRRPSLPRKMSKGSKIQKVLLRSSYLRDHWAAIVGHLSVFFRRQNLDVPRWVRLRFYRRKNPQICTQSSSPTTINSLVSSFVRVFAVGLSLGIGVLFRNPVDEMGWALLAVALCYCFGICFLGCFLTRLSKRHFIFSCSTLNALVTPFSLLSLLGASSVTGIWEKGGAWRALPWFLPVLFFPIFGGAVLLSIRAVVKARSLAKLVHFERKSILLLVIPTFVFLYYAKLPGTLSERWDYFHGAETLVPGWLMHKGLLPWRGLMFLHGLLEDPFKSLLGIRLFEPTMWGAMAGQTLLFVPLFFVGVYFLHYMLFRKNVWHLFLATAVAPLLWPPLFEHYFPRYLLYPLVLISFRSALVVPSFVRCFTFSFLALLQALVTPESSYLVISCGITFVLKEVYEFHEERTLLQNFRGSLTTLLGGILFVILLFGGLCSLGVTHDFVSYYSLFGSEHRYSGGIPINFPGLMGKLAAHIPILTMCLVVIYVSTRHHSKRRFSPTEWSMASVALFTLFYYQKFLGRADGHVYQSFTVSVPLVYFFVSQGISWADRNLANFSLIRRPLQWPLRTIASTLVALVGGYMIWPVLLLGVRTIPSHFQSQAELHASFPQFGYVDDQAQETLVIHDFTKLFDYYLEPNDTIFDFTNQPLLFHYFLDRIPASRYYNISMAIHEPVQEELIEDLKRVRPKLVIFHSKTKGLDAWDGIPTMIRHHHVSRYLLGHYRSLFRLNGNLVMLRNDINHSLPPESLFAGKISLAEGLESVAECDWGYVPHFWKEELKAYPTEIARFHPSLPFITIEKGDHFLTQISHPFRGLRQLEIEFGELLPDRFFVAPEQAALSNPFQRVSFTSLNARNVLYRIGVDNCVQKDSFLGNKIYLQHEKHHRILNIRAIDTEGTIG